MLATTGPMVQSGRNKVLAAAAKERLGKRPDIPTVAESGRPAGYEVNPWIAFLVPRFTPPTLFSG